MKTLLGVTEMEIVLIGIFIGLCGALGIVRYTNKLIAGPNPPARVRLVGRRTDGSKRKY
jgi:hypothetical protein